MTDPSFQPRILIVDDTWMNVSILVEALRSEYKLGVATNGAKALEYAVKHRPDLILLDIMMPEMDGYEVCTRLKANKETTRIPVLFITALDEIEDKSRGFELGAVDYITKPFEVVEVQARVRTHLELERYRKELEKQNQALRQARDRLQHQIGELEGRDRLVRAQMSVTSQEQACKEILEVAGRVAGLEQGVLYQPDGSGERLVVKETLSPEIIPASVETGSHDSLVVQAFERKEVQERNGEAAFPLLYREEVLGILWVEGIHPARVSRAEGFESLRRLAREAALVLHAARLAEELERGDMEVEALLNMSAKEE